MRFRKKKTPEPTVTWIHDYRASGRTYPEWYAYTTHEPVVRVEYNDRVVTVCADGEMRYEDPKGRVRTVTPDDLLMAGLSNDEDIEKAHAKTLFLNNPWFDLYDGDGEWLDYVTFDLDEAVKAAKEIVLK